MKQTYELVPDRPLPVSWSDYYRDVMAEWRQILDSEPTERQVQQFLEQHPSMVPGGEGGLDSIGGHHGAFPGALITQAELPGLTRPIPDFLWVSKRSSVVHPVLIEIERPSKRYFRPAEAVQSRDLSNAVAQVASWKKWFDDEAHRKLFYKRYGIDDFVREYHRIVPVYCLIYGRRKEFASDPELSTTRDHLRPDWLVWKSFDSLRPAYDARHFITVRPRSGHFEVVAVPPTLELGPENVETLLRFDGLEAAIEGNEAISPERRAFLLKRLPYWQAWISADRKGFYTVGDFE